jgi:hypothetical protein
MVSFLDGLEAYLATFSDPERAVSRHAFEALLAGRAMLRTDFAAPLALAPSVADAAIDRHVERGTMLVEDGRVVAARGLSLSRAALARARARARCRHRRADGHRDLGGGPRSRTLAPRSHVTPHQFLLLGRACGAVGGDDDAERTPAHAV